MKYVKLLDQLFAKKRIPGKVTFQRELKPQVLVYKWENEFAYKAPFRILPSTAQNEDLICQRIEMKYPEFLKRKEYYLFADQVKYITNEDIHIRPLSYQDEAMLQDMKDACVKQEVDVANISVYDGYVLGAFFNHKLVGVCSCEEFYGVLDLAVLVHPDYRRRKIASMLISTNAQRAIEKEGLCLYRVDDFNIASYETAQKLGFIKKIEVIFYELEENR